MVSESQRRLIEEGYAVAAADGGPLRCEADRDVNAGATPVVYENEWTARAAADKFALLDDPDWVPYPCPLAADMHYHLCRPELAVRCPRCGSDPGMVCFAVETAPVDGLWLRRPEPHPERGNVGAARQAAGVAGSGGDLDVGRLAGPLTVVGLSVTAGSPPLIYELTVANIVGGITPESPLTFYVQPDTREADIPARARLSVSKAPTWSEVAERISEAIGAGPPLVLYGPTAHQILQAHFPDRPMGEVIYALDIGRQAWPDLYRDVPGNAAPTAAQVYGICGLITAVLVHAHMIPVPPERSTPDQSVSRPPHCGDSTEGAS